jgi:hypothetical protein
MLGQLAWRAFGIGYGFFNLVVMVGIAAIRDGALMKRPSESEKKELGIGMLSLSAGLRWLYEQD